MQASKLLCLCGMLLVANAQEVFKMEMLFPAKKIDSSSHLESVKQSNPPTFGSFYTVSGEIEIPYTELRETFTAFYDADAKRSRIDYYDGLVITIQRGDTPQFGANYKIAYMSTDTELNQRNCFAINATDEGSRVDAQTVFPDTSDMQLSGTELVRGYVCEKWVKVNEVNGRVNTYTLHVTVGSRLPVRYEMMGYDTLLGSHFDKYIVEYFAYNNDVRPDAAVFNVPADLTCHGFPGPGSGSLNRVLMNPISEYVRRDRPHVDEAFEHFKQTHGAKYDDEVEHNRRRDLFARNLRYIQSHNRRGVSYQMAVNRFADRSSDELRVLRGYRSSRRSSPSDEPAGNKLEDTKRVSKRFGKAKKVDDIPDEMNWVIRGAVTPVRDQAICGSCWSFGTTGALEGAYFLKTGNLVALSQQQLIDCSWGYGNNGCDGGEDFRSYDWVQKNGGLAADAIYGAYLGQDGRCNLNVPRAVQLTGYVNITPYDTDALRKAIATVGPISVAIDASHPSFAFYSHGVYYEPTCGNKPEQLDHAVLAVGYGTLNGEPYWLVKNSWSTYWGTQGYVLMSQKDNNCGVATSPTYPLVA